MRNKRLCRYETRNMNNNATNTPQLPNRLVTLRWLDNGTCPDETLASLVEQYRNSCREETIKTIEGMTRPISMTTFVHGNAVDIKMTSFHGLIDLDKDLYPVLTNARATNEQVFSKAAFSLEDTRLTFFAGGGCERTA